MRKKSKAILGIFSALGISSLVAAGCAFGLSNNYHLQNSTNLNSSSTIASNNTNLNQTKTNTNSLVNVKTNRNNFSQVSNETLLTDVDSSTVTSNPTITFTCTNGNKLLLQVNLI